MKSRIYCHTPLCPNWPLLVIPLLVCASPFPGSADSAGAKAVTDCAALAERTVHEYTILSATQLEAKGDIPERCRVLGVLPPEIVFEVVLPSDWNGRILMRGNGGLCGHLAKPTGPSPQLGANRRGWICLGLYKHWPRPNRRTAGHVCLQQSPEGDRLQLPRRPPNHPDRQGTGGSLLRPAAKLHLLVRLFDGRTPRADGGPAISEGLRRHLGRSSSA